MFRGLVNIWNYFSENVTALRMRDSCCGVTLRKEAKALGDWYLSHKYAFIGLVPVRDSMNKTGINY